MTSEKCVPRWHHPRCTPLSLFENCDTGRPAANIHDRAVFDLEPRLFAGAWLIDQPCAIQSGAIPTHLLLRDFRLRHARWYPHRGRRERNPSFPQP